MSLMNEINVKLKTAMLDRDEFAKITLGGLKSAVLYEEVAKNKRDTGLDDAEIEVVVAREVKKRDDAIEIYTSAGDTARAEKEMAEREILSSFLPEPLNEGELREIIERVIATGGFTNKDMGRAIGDVKKEVGTKADGAQIAQLVKEMLQS